MRPEKNLLQVFITKIAFIFKVVNMQILMIIVFKDIAI